MQNGAPSLGAAQNGISRLSVENSGSKPGETGAGAIVPVGDVRSAALPAPDLEGIRSVETHTRNLGVIQPPPDLKAIVDKTATFVAKNGSQFEAKIRDQQQNNPRFNFLRPTDVYHAYFKHAIARELRESAGDKPATVVQQAEQAAALAQQAAPAPVAPSTLAKPLVAPEPDIFSVRTPEGLTAENVDIIKLTAQCVARNGPNFLSGLGQKEHNNPTFLFLKPTHSLHGYFKDLTEAYKFTLLPPKEQMAKLRRDAIDRQSVLERCLNRLEWEKNKEALDKAASDKATAERLAMQSIDWHDFVVVETIDFFDDEDDDLPAPMTQKDIVLLNRANAFRDENADEETTNVEANGADNVEMDEDERAMVEEGNAPPEEPIAPPMPPQAPIPVEADDDGPMRIVKDYQRPSARPGGPSTAGMAVSPITGELVPLAQMAEHMRISLMDPQWKTQRETMLSKIRETTQASDDEISRNLVDLAGHRPDVFGSSEEEVGAMVKATMDEKKMTGNERTPAWDGQTTGGASLHNQMKAINEHKAETNKRKEPEPPSIPTPILGPMPGNLPPPPSSGNSLPGPPIRLPAGAPAPVMNPPAPGPPPPIVRPSPTAATSAPPPVVLPPPTLVPPITRPPPIVRATPPAPSAQSAAPAAPLPPSMPAPPPIPADQPGAKRQRVDFVLQSEEEFLQQYPGASKVRILCPEESDNPNLNGQVLEVEVASLASSIGELKSRLADVLGLPTNKQQLSREHFRNLKDVDTLAYYNVSPEVELVLGIRRRGGR